MKSKSKSERLAFQPIAFNLCSTVAITHFFSESCIPAQKKGRAANTLPARPQVQLKIYFVSIGRILMLRKVTTPWSPCSAMYPVSNFAKFAICGSL